MSFFCWFNDDKRMSLAQKISQAIAAYTERYDIRPNIVLTCPADAAQLSRLEGAVIQGRQHIRPGYYWIAWDPAYEVAA